METFVNELIEYIKTLVSSNNQVLVIFLAAFIIIIESIIPIIPLALFITLNMLIFGSTYGFILSWVATIIGCILSFAIFRRGLNRFTNRILEKYFHGEAIMKIIDDISFSKLVLITAVPFTPAFSVNIACGLSKMSFKKYFFAIALAKISIVYFWGFIGTSLIASLSDVKILFKILFVLLITYVVSLVVRKYLDIN